MPEQVPPTMLWHTVHGRWLLRSGYWKYGLDVRRMSMRRRLLLFWLLLIVIVGFKRLFL